MLPADAYLQLTPDLRICRVLNGMWQVSGAHGPIDPDAAVRAMAAHHEAGFTTWDLADHYGPAEDFIGRFLREYSPEGMVAFTKWVPRPGPVSEGMVRAAIERSLKRMDVPALDLLQFHWWEYSDSNYLIALRHLDGLRQEGLIRHLALTNFDTEHLRVILDAGIPIVSNQVQYSLVDRRPEVAMVPFCLERGVKLLPYGLLCGGLISERYLGRPEPSRGELTTASLQKYKRMIDAWGVWALFQELLQALASIAVKYEVSLANVATRYVLERPAVAGPIIGVRLGSSDHLADNVRVFEFTLDAEDQALLDGASGKGQDLYRSIGDCGDEYR